jgi:hypothetical protein
MANNRNSQNLTCFQSRCPRPNLPPPRLRKRNKPVVMRRSKTMSMESITMKDNLFFLTTGKLQVSCAGTHEERT